VGAFGLAAERRAPRREAMRSAHRNGMPCVGLSHGMQLLFDDSDEAPPNVLGLGLIAGRVTRLAARRVPQIGWNSVDPLDDAMFEVAPVDFAYYANSFVCRPSDCSVVRAWSTHADDRFPAVVRAQRTIGVQFHPEKSSAPGLRFLRAILAEVSA
jgi:glutamine amidotransferase